MRLSSMNSTLMMIFRQLCRILLPLAHKTIILGVMRNQYQTGAASTERLMTARFTSKCRSCWNQIQQGEQIRYSRDNGARHAYDCQPIVNQAANFKTEPDKLLPGVYENADGIFVVKFNREKTRVYAKKLVQMADRMPVERAKELITLYGKCINCNRHLKAAKSVEQGIGPVCIKAFGPVLNPEVETTDGRQIRRAA